MSNRSSIARTQVAPPGDSNGSSSTSILLSDCPTFHPVLRKDFSSYIPHYGLRGFCHSEVEGSPSLRKILGMSMGGYPFLDRMSCFVQITDSTCRFKKAVSMITYTDIHSHTINMTRYSFFSNRTVSNTLQTRSSGRPFSSINGSGSPSNRKETPNPMGMRIIELY